VLFKSKFRNLGLSNRIPMIEVNSQRATAYYHTVPKVVLVEGVLCFRLLS
jgi:hypothetical protein